VILLIGFPVMAQEEPAEELTPEQQEAIAQAEERSFEEEITVTGSLIPRPTLESLSPVSVMDPEQITYTGVLRLEDVVGRCRRSSRRRTRPSPTAPRGPSRLVLVSNSRAWWPATRGDLS
jgi:hypothetical protein